jgi:hypothetical protein
VLGKTGLSLQLAETRNSFFVTVSEFSKVSNNSLKITQMAGTCSDGDETPYFITAANPIEYLATAHNINFNESRDNSVGIATDYGLDG